MRRKMHSAVNPYRPNEEIKVIDRRTVLGFVLAAIPASACARTPKKQAQLTVY